jgi:hypothetical protein
VRASAPPPLTRPRTALEAGDDIVEPAFYCQPWRCSEPIMRIIFRPAESCKEHMPMLAQRRDAMRQCGELLFRKVRPPPSAPRTG